MIIHKRYRSQPAYKASDNYSRSTLHNSIIKLNQDDTFPMCHLEEYSLNTHRNVCSSTNRNSTCGCVKNRTLFLIVHHGTALKIYMYDIHRLCA